MKFRPRPIAAGFLVAACTLAIAQPAAAKPKPAPNNWRNVIVVMTDDQTVADMRVMAKTNALLAGEGATFENFYVSYSLCCPSRAAFLSGQYSHNNGVMGNEQLSNGEGGYPAQRNRRNLLPAWLARAGYRTGHVGKYLNAYGRGRWGGWNSPLSIPSGWTDWMGAPAASAYKMYDYRLNLRGKMRWFGSTPGDYQTDVYRRLALDFLKKHRTRKFFLSVAPLAPHTELNVEPPREAPRHTLTEVPPLMQPPSFNEDDLSDKPGWLQQQPLIGPERIEEFETLNAARLRSLLAVDDLVEALYNRLVEYDLLDRTYILFTSDNGYLFGEHRLATKNFHYTESSQVPLLIRGPGISPGSRIEALGANVDLAPTIAQMTGVRPGLPQDGVSLLPVLTGAAESVREDMLLQNFEGRNYLEDGTLELLGVGTHRGVRTTRYTYVEYFDGSRELYDNQEDPFQLTNLYDPAATGELAELQDALAARLGELVNCAGSACR